MANREYLKKTALGGITNNPVFVLVLGMCPTLAMSNSIESALWLGIATFGVLLCTNVVISLLRKLIPDRVRIPCYILVIATFVTIADMLLGRFLPKAIYNNISAAISLIVVNCIILARAEAFASNNKPHYALLDAASMGVGFLAAIMLLAGFRVLLGQVLGIAIFLETAGGFLMLAILMAVFNYVMFMIKAKQKPRLLVAEEQLKPEEQVREAV